MKAMSAVSVKQIELLQFLELNHMGWSAAMAPAIMGNPDRPELGEELTNSFCRTDPEIAKDSRGSRSIPTTELTCEKTITDAHSSMQRRHHRLQRGGRVRSPRHTRQRDNPFWRRPAIVPISAPLTRLSPPCERSSELWDDFPQSTHFQDMFENAPCGYITVQTNGLYRAREQDAAGMDRPYRERHDRQAVERFRQYGGPHR